VTDRRTWRKSRAAVATLVALFAVAALALAGAVPAGADVDPTVPRIAIDISDFAFQGRPLQVFYFCLPGSLGSPVVTCEGDVPSGGFLDTSRAGTFTFTVHAVDSAGSESTMTQTYLIIDIIPPTVTITTPAEGAVYPVGAQVYTDYSCDDPNGSGVVFCLGTGGPSGFPLPTNQPGTFTFRVGAVDAAFNFTSATVTYTVVDATPPQIIIASPSNGAVYRYGDPITPSFSCHDDVDGSNVPCTSTPATVETSLGTHTYRVDSVDSSGNHSSASITYTVADETPPQITIGSPTDGAVYHVGDPISASFSCHDDVDGANVLCTATPEAVDTSPGTHTFRVDSVDAAGNAAFATVTYSVHYDFDGFYAPLVAEPGSVEVKAGEPVPVKFSLHGDHGRDVISRPAWHPCDTGRDAATTASGSLTYNANLDRYTYAWTSSKSWAGTCTELLLTLRDGTTQAEIGRAHV